MSESTTAVVLVDLQRAFCAEDGSAAAQGRNISANRRAAERCARIADVAHAAGIPVIWTRFVLDPDYLLGGRLIYTLRPDLRTVSALKAGSRDVELLPNLPVAAHDLVIDKPRYSALYGSSLEVALRALAVESLVVGGVTTSMCVESTVRDASQRDYRVTVVQDAVADFDEGRHSASLRAMEFGFASLATVEDVPAILGRRGGRSSYAHSPTPNERR